MAYDAFISYSHAADGRLAPAVQLGLQRLARPWYRARSLRVFRDDTGLAVNPHLWISIQQALDESEYFVLLASPEAAASPWVNREIEHWTAHKSPDRLLPVLTDGTLLWDAARGNYNLDLSDALPPALAAGFPAEPRHLDLRWARDETELDLRHARFRGAIADLAAPMHHLPKDELESEDVRQHRRTVRLARGATIGLVLLLVAALASGFFAWKQRTAAQRQAAVARQAATTALGRGIAAQSLNALHDGRNDLALLLAVEANEITPTESSRASLLNAIGDQPALDRQLHGLSQTTSALAFSPDGRLLAAQGDQLRVWDLGSGQLLGHQPEAASVQPSLPTGTASDLRFGDQGRVLVAAYQAPADPGPFDFVVWDVSTGHILQHIHADASRWTVSANAAVLAADGANGTLALWNVRNGKVLASIPTSRPQGNVAVSADGASIAVASTDTRAWNVTSGQPLGPACRSTIATGPSVLSIDVLPDDQTVRVVNVDRNFGTYAVIDRCHARSGVAEPQNITANAPIAGLSPDGSLVATRTDVGTIQLLDAARGSAVGGPVSAPYGGYMVVPAGTVVFSSDSRHFAATEYNGDVRLWHTSLDPPLGQRVEIAADAMPVVEAPSGNIGVTASGDIIDTQTQRRIGRAPDPGAVRAQQLSFSPDGRLLASWRPGSLTLADLRQHNSRTLRTEGLPCNDVAQSVIAVSERIAVLGCIDDRRGSTMLLQPFDLSSWPWRPGNPVHVDVWPFDAKFSPDGRALIVFGNGFASGLQLVDVSGAELQPRPLLSGERGGNAAFSPDSHTLVFAHANGLVELMDIRRRGGRSRELARSADRFPNDIAVSSDGLLVAAVEGTAQNTNEVDLWDLRAQQLIGVVPLSGLGSGQVRAFTDKSLTVVGDAGTLGATSSSTPPRLQVRFNLDHASLERRACIIANRNLTPTEWSQYVSGRRYQKVCPALP